MAGSEALTRSVLADQVKERLLEAILDGSYPPDSRIVETAVAKELGTSQAPVREALRGLEALGIVEITPFRGARVRRLDQQELLEAYVVRSAIETLGARLAMPRMSDDDIEVLATLGEQMQQAAASGDGHAVAVADASFHEHIMNVSGNRTLLRMWRSLEPFSRTYITLIVPGSDPQWTADLHQPILDAVARRDTAAAVRAIELHFDDVSTRLADRLADSPPGTDAVQSVPSGPSGPTTPAAQTSGRRGKASKS
jgi:DNA-binding GntR family transcriptional regulator